MQGPTFQGQTRPVRIVGGGLAGSEAAWQLLSHGVPVVMYEMRPVCGTAAHQTEQLAELVCSNSFRSDDAMHNAVGLLHEEMRRLNSLIMQAGDANQLPAGGALAVDRHGFAKAVQDRLLAHPLFELRREAVESLPVDDDNSWIIATGPLTHAKLAQSIRDISGSDQLAFFDAIAPIIHRESIDMDKAWFQSRYDKPGPGGTGADYLNCPLDQSQYEAFIKDLLDAEKTEFREWEKNTPYFESCLPIEVMAERGPETLRFGPMKPVGLTDPRSGTRSHAVIQLRQDNALGTLFNIVGFQTKLKYGEQIRIFRKIPGLEQAEFARLGGLHRNTFIKSPDLLNERMELKAAPHIHFAGQITGVEGYVESAAVGLVVGRMLAAKARDRKIDPPPPETAHGALINHVTKGAVRDSFQPMNVNFGLFPPLGEKTRKNERKERLARRALEALAVWQEKIGQPLDLACH